MPRSLPLAVVALGSIGLSGAAASVQAVQQSLAECRAAVRSAEAAKRNALQRVAAVNLRPMTLAELQELLGDTGYARREHGTNQWVVEWYRGPDPDEATAVRWCLGGRRDDPYWLQSFPAVEATFVTDSRPEPGAFPRKIEIRAPFPASLMGLRIGESDEALRAESSYSFSSEESIRKVDPSQPDIASVDIARWNVRWGTKGGRIAKWIIAEDPRWRIDFVPRRP